MILRLLLIVAVTGQVALSQECENGWLKYDLENMCVYLGTQRSTWNQAQDNCISKNGNLVVIKTEEKNTWLSDQISGSSNEFWIGLHDRITDHNYIWSDGTMLEAQDYDNWSPGEPNENDGLNEDCVEMYPSGKWNDEQCLAVVNFICERSADVPAPTPANEPPCPLGWRKYETDQRCVLVVPDELRIFNGARDYCTSLGGDLVMLKNSAFNAWVTDLISIYSGGVFWIGMVDRPVEKEWEWVDDTPVEWFNWAPNEPNLLDPLGEDCVEIYATGKWNDEQCQAPQNFICGKPTVDPTQQPTPARSTHAPAIGVECGVGWMKYQDTCVLVVSEKRTFYLAQQYCQDRSSNLLVLQSQDMNNWLADQTSVYRQTYWIGLNDRIEDNTFVWIDDSPLTFTNWNPGDPNNYDGIGEDCVEMLPGGKWNDEQCLAAQSFACSKGYDEIPKCDLANGWESYGGKCYLWVSDTKNINDATTYCTMLGGYVISINDGDEQRFADTVQIRYLNLQYWIGLSNKDSINKDNYIWQDGTDDTNYNNWAILEPATMDNGCAYIKSSTPDTWQADDCGVKKRFMCERDEGTCADGWVLHGGQCYQFNALLRTWYDASFYCSSQGGWLASVLDGAENTFIAINMEGIQAQGTEQMWIGYSDSYRDETWAWEHDTSPDFENFLPGKPAYNPGVADCAYMETNDVLGTWYAMQCTLLAGFVCKIKAGSSVTPVEEPTQVGSCERGWSLYGDSCYYSPIETKTKADAELECNGMFSNAHLVSIHSPLEQSFITERLYYINENTWIGLNDEAVEGTWVWTDGSAYDFQNWSPDEPNGRGGEDCVHMDNYFYKIGTWNDHICSNVYRFICKMPKYNTPVVTATPPITLPPSSRCGRDWVYDVSGKECYKFVTSMMPWAQADDQCHYEGGLLASITNPDESEFLYNSGQYYRVNEGWWVFWIGLHDADMEHGYEWTDGSPLAYLNWGPGEPNDASIGEDCVEFQTGDGRWNDLKCDTELPYICKQNSFITNQFIAYPNARIEVSAEVPVSNLWPEECAINCYAAGTACRSFNYYRKTRTCSILTASRDDGHELVPEFEDPYDYYERDFGGPPIYPATTIGPSYGCAQGETGYRSYCYTLVDSTASFNNMQDVCALRSSKLVSIADASEMNFVISLMQTGNTPTKAISQIWLGLTDADREATYAWSDGSEVTYTNWAAGEPQNNVNNDDCVVHNFNLDGWVDLACTGTSAYGVCKKPKQTSNVVSPSTDGCPSGWLKYMTSCYQLVTNKKTWDNARLDCLNKNGRLTTINSKYEQAYLASQMGAIFVYNFDYWIGLSDTVNPGTYLWVDGSYPILSAWAPGQPNDNIFGKCVAMIGGLVPDIAGLWMDENCIVEHNYICERPMDGTTDTPYTQAPATDPTNIGCEDFGAIGYGSNCFIVYEKDTAAERLLWAAARSFCVENGGDLASFSSKAEESYIINKYTPADPAVQYGYWLGINDISNEAGFEWSDGSPVIYVNWDSGEPSNGGSGEDCGEMFLVEGRGWNDIPCTNIFRNWICKKPKKITPDPTLPTITSCPTNEDWKYVSPYCYYFSDWVGNNDRFSWDEAEDYCHQQGGHLVSIQSDTENAVLVAMAPTIATNYWIGLRQEVRSGGYEWSDGSTFVYANWDHGEPNNHNGEEMCAELYRYNGLQQNGMWNDANCGVNTPFICKRLEDSINPITHSPTETPVGGCDNGYFKYYNRCYRMVGYEESDKSSWTGARDICQSEGGNLVGIHSKEVQSLLTSMMIDVTGDVWIGFTDSGSNGQYHWTDGKAAVYTNWYPGRPSGFITLPGAPARNCVEMMNEPWYAGMWGDIECELIMAYVCEKDLVPDVDDNPPSSLFCDDESYYKYGDSCFKLDVHLRTYEEAQTFCESEGGNIASITDAYYEAFLEYILFSSGQSAAWIGMTSDADGVYTWTDGWPVHFSKWGDSEPSQKDGEGCVVLNNLPSWDDTTCTDLYPTICRTTSATPDPPVESTTGYCAPGQSEFGGHCYVYPDDTVSTEWFSALSDCQSLYGGDLASIHSKEENEFVRNLIVSNIGLKRVWLGLERTDTGGFQWSDLTPVDYVHWANNEPTEEWRGTAEDCVEMMTGDIGNWNDADCYTGSSYICKIPKYNNETSSEPVNDSLSGGAIAGIVIACVVILTVVLLVVAWFVGSRKGPKLPTTTTTTSTTKDPFPTPASGFDNVVYTPDATETNIQSTA